MLINNLGEFKLIDTFAGKFPCPGHILGIGDDCAVMPQEEGMETLVSTDMLIEGIHFLLDDISAYNLGWKSAMVNLSDIAAMGGQPQATFLALSLPGSTTSSWTDSFTDGFRDACIKGGATLLGGDTTSSTGPVSICVTVVGKCALGRSKKRSTARPGDGIFVTGCLGDSAAGLKVVLEGKQRTGASEKLLEKHYRPKAKVAEGMVLCGLDTVHAMMDISDGIGSDIKHILESSGVGAVIDAGKIPLSPEIIEVCKDYGWDPVDLAVNGGEDYELLFTAGPEFKEPFDCFRIGTITAEAGLVSDGPEFNGFRHF